jgi:dephospho-CoA kinase
MTRDGLTREDALKRIRAQIPLATKCIWADVEIDNSQDRLSTSRQVEQLVLSMNRLSRRRRLLLRFAVFILIFTAMGMLIYSCL